MIYPLLPAFVTGVLGAGPHASLRRGVGGSSVRGPAVMAVLVGGGRGDGRGTGRAPPPRAPPPRPPGVSSLGPRSPLPGITVFYLLRMPDTLVILRSQQLGVPTAAVPLLWAAVHVVRSPASFAGGALTDRLGPSRPMRMGWPTSPIRALGMAQTRSV